MDLSDSLCMPLALVGRKLGSIGDRFVQLTAAPSFGNGAAELAKPTDGLLIAAASFVPSGDLKINYAGKEGVRFRYLPHAPVASTVGGRKFVGHRAQIIVQPTGASQTDEYSAGAQTRFLSVFFSRRTLLDAVSTDLNDLPTRLADVIEGRDAEFGDEEIPLGRGALSILAQIFEVRNPTISRPLFLQAKSLELVSMHLDALCGLLARPKEMLTARDRRIVNEALRILALARRCANQCSGPRYLPADSASSSDGVAARATAEKRLKSRLPG